MPDLKVLRSGLLVDAETNEPFNLTTYQETLLAAIASGDPLDEDEINIQITEDERDWCVICATVISDDDQVGYQDEDGAYTHLECLTNRDI